jgi:hypothetical protein
MNNFKNRQRPRRKYRFDIVGHKKALKIWCDSPFNKRNKSWYYEHRLLLDYGAMRVPGGPCNMVLELPVPF